MIELDSTFVSAYYWLANAHTNLGNTDARHEALKRAKRHSKNATDMENLYVEVSYVNHILGDREQAIRILEQMVKKYPKEKRDESKLLIVDRKKREIYHEIFKNLPKFLKPRDLIIVNDTKVIPARLKGRKETGGQVEILLLNTAWENVGKNEKEQVWEVLINSSKKVKIPSYITLKKGFYFTVR